MLAKIWKPIGVLILTIACLFTITIKLVNTVSFKNQVNSTLEAPLQEEEVKNE